MKNKLDVEKITRQIIDAFASAYGGPGFRLTNSELPDMFDQQLKTDYEKGIKCAMRKLRGVLKNGKF